MSPAPDLGTLFTPEDVCCRIDVPDRLTLLRRMVHTLRTRHALPETETIVEQLEKREQQGSTVLDRGIALPHARLPELHGLVLGVATTASDVAFHADEKARVVLLILTPLDEPSLYLQVASSLARLCQSRPLADELPAIESATGVWKYISQAGVCLEPYVRAGDVMDPAIVCLRETDTLETAISALVEHRRAELPVVDVAGDLIGVVNARQLLRVCLPDYILWVDDLDPIVRFEPFTDILRHERQTWLTEILTHEFAMVERDAPAMQAARQMARYNTTVAYVLEGERLVGTIRLTRFLDKVLRA